MIMFIGLVLNVGDKINLDETIKKTTNWKNVVSSITDRMFDIDAKDAGVERIYIDVNSCFSVMFRAMDANESVNIDRIKEILEKFMNKNLIYRCQLIFLFSFEASKLHQSIFPDWCKERYARVNIKNNNFLLEFLVALKKYSSTNSSIKILNTHHIHPALVVYNSEVKSKKPFLILSKDLVFYSVNLDNASIFNGNKFIDLSQDNIELPSGIIIPDAKCNIPFYISLTGSSREEFSGLKGFGPKRSFDYLLKYKLNIKLNTDHPHKEHCDKYSVLFDVRKLIEMNDDHIPII